MPIQDVITPPVSELGAITPEQKDVIFKLLLELEALITKTFPGNKYLGPVNWLLELIAMYVKTMA